MKKRLQFFGERGSVLIIALLVLAFFTLLGVSTFSISTMEIRIIGNENTQKQNLYCAEAAAMRCAQDMHDTNLRSTIPAHFNAINTVTENDIRNCSFPSQETFAQLPATTYASVSQGIAPGSSLDMTKTRVHDYAVYGWCSSSNNLAMVEVGYRKAFK
jgi:Tfp pilus assembly protein PilX